nr:putative uncharacterized protein ENSP00000383309 [Penaeus vannamei]
MGLTVVGTFLPSYLPDWPVDNLSLWLSLAEGLLLPLVLGLVDATFSGAAGASCSREKPQPHKYDDGDGPFRLFPKDEVKSFPLTNGSLFSSLLNMSVDNPAQILPSYRRGGGAGMKMGVSSQEIRGLVAAGPPPRVRDPYGPPFYPREATESLGSAATSSQDPIYSDPLTKVGSVGSSLKEDHIYATLSETSLHVVAESEASWATTSAARPSPRSPTTTSSSTTRAPPRRPRPPTPPRPRPAASPAPATWRWRAAPPRSSRPEALRDEADDAYGLSSAAPRPPSLAASSSFRSASSQSRPPSRAATAASASTSPRRTIAARATTTTTTTRTRTSGATATTWASTTRATSATRSRRSARRGSRSAAPWSRWGCGRRRRRATGATTARCRASTGRRRCP